MSSFLKWFRNSKSDNINRERTPYTNDEISENNQDAEDDMSSRNIQDSRDDVVSENEEKFFDSDEGEIILRSSMSISSEDDIYSSSEMPPLVYSNGELYESSNISSSSEEIEIQVYIKEQLPNRPLSSSEEYPSFSSEEEYIIAPASTPVEHTSSEEFFIIPETSEPEILEEKTTMEINTTETEISRPAIDWDKVFGNYNINNDTFETQIVNPFDQEFTWNPSNDVQFNPFDTQSTEKTHNKRKSISDDQEKIIEPEYEVIEPVVTINDINDIVESIGDPWQDVRNYTEEYDNAYIGESQDFIIEIDNSYKQLKLDESLSGIEEYEEEFIDIEIEPNNRDIHITKNDKIRHVTAVPQTSGYLEINIGGMFSGKTTAGLMKLSKMADVGFKCLYINHSCDNRATEAQDAIVTTHNSQFTHLSDKITAIKVEKLEKVNVSEYDYIFVDELQFFSDGFEMVDEWVTSYGKYLIVASLDGDAYRRKFGDVLDLIPHADKVTKFTAYCDICREEKGVLVAAPFTGRIESDNTESKLVGGRDHYRAMCRHCHDSHIASSIEY